MAIKKVQLDIEGMHCGSCATGIQMYLSNTEGIKEVFVDYEKKKGEVEFDDEKITVDKIIQTVEELDYKAKEAKKKPLE